MLAEHQDTLKTSVLLADDHKLVCEAVSEFLEKSGLFEVVISGNVSDALQALEECKPAVMLLDIQMPGMEGLQTISKILNEHPNVKVVIFSGFSDGIFVERAVALGVRGFIPKSISLKSLSSILNLIVSGEPYFPHEYLFKSYKNVNAHGLNEVEISILRSVAEGLSNKQIAIDLDRSEAAIKMHMRTICRKLGASNRSHAVTLARKLSLIET